MKQSLGIFEKALCNDNIAKSIGSSPTNGQIHASSSKKSGALLNSQKKKNPFNVVNLEDEGCDLDLVNDQGGPFKPMFKKKGSFQITTGEDVVDLEEVDEN
jgi:hypothetical protein